MLPQAASNYYRAQQRLIVATLALIRREWAQMGDDFDTSWQTVGPRLTLLVGSAQLGAARNSAGYVPAAVDELGGAPDPLGRVNPEGFAGFASDGRPLESLLYGAVVQARTVSAGSSSERLAAGGRWLDMAAHTQVADVGRQAAQVGITATPRAGWVRLVNPPCCQRCAVLAGRVYSHSQGFRRHPRCDCTMIPTTVANPNPAGAAIEQGDVKDLTDAQRRAIADGADMNQVINSHRGGARSRNGMTTSEGTTRRGLAGQRGARRRLTPEGIYKVSSTREEAVRRLRDNGYLL